MKRRVLCALVALAPAQARADGIAIVGGSPRAIGRAGAATVGDDGGGALLINPAAMARRDTTRAQLGVAVIEDDVSWQADANGAPLSRGQAGSRLAPLGAALGGIGGWVIGVGAMTAAVSERSLARPADNRGGDLASFYNYRYAGIAGAYRRDTLAFGVARRFGSSLAFGLSLGIAQLHVTEHRRIWAGFGGREPIGASSSDLDIVLAATDRLSESVVAGILYAPEDTQIELGASVGWARTVKLDGTIDADSVPPDPEHPMPMPSVATTAAANAAPHASLEVPQPLAVRAGGRYVGDRVVAELDGDLWIAPPGAESTTWVVSGIRVVDPSGVYSDLRRIPSRISQHSHVAVRVAADFELMPGFLWATGGAAFSTPGTPANRLSPSFGDLGGSTLGLGLEANAGGFTVTLGWSRTWLLSTKAPTALQLDNPFVDGGDGPVLPGRYGGSIDQIGVMVEAELSHPSR